MQNAWEFGVPYASAVVGAWLVTYFLHSTVWLLGARLLVAPRTTSRRVADIAWKSALLGGIVTTSIALATSSRPALGRYDASAFVEAPMWTQDSRGAQLPAPVIGDTATRVARFAARIPHSLSALRYVPALLVMLWVSYAAVVLGRVVRATTRARRALGPRRALDAHDDTRFRGVLAEMGYTRAVHITVADALESPVALGGSEITIPRRLLADLTPDDQCSVVAHEVAHLVRRDPQWLLAIATLESLFFFQPLHRMARMHWQDNAEYLCDELAVRKRGTALSLARALSRVAEWLAGNQPYLAPALAESSTSLLGRVRALLDESDTHAPRVTRGGALARASVSPSVVIALPAIAVPLIALGVVPVATPGAVHGWGTAAFAWAEPMPRGSTIEIQGVLGSIRADLSEHDTVDVRATRHGRATTPDIHFDVVRHPGGVTICAVYPSPRGTAPNECVPGSARMRNSRDNDVEVEFAIRVPRGVNVRMVTANGSITTGPLQSVVVAATLTGEIDINTSEYASAQSNSGDVRAVIGRVNWPDTLRLASLSGNINVTLPANARVDVVAETMRGTIASDFEVGERASGPRMMLSTRVGNIRVQRQR